ncbi:hypothetical protein TSA6c_16895 [Azospirillum sp. TSA6c]|nr:hypothetical protein TSA6c_16895 [Azospirillum sp. TSA6c]
MPSPTLNMAHVDRPLTNMSIAYMQSATGFVFNRVFPLVYVEKESDKYYVFDIETFLRGRARRRADGTESAGGGYKLSTDSYSLGDPFAFHKDVTKRERDNADKPLDPDRNATDFVTQNILITAEEEWVGNFFKPGVWDGQKIGGDTTPFWNDYASSNPITAVADARLWIWKNTGRKPNKFTVDPTTDEVLKNHPLILDRTEGQVIDANVLAKLFEVDEYLVAGGVHRTGAEGVGTGDFIAGKHALLSYAAPNPAKEMPSCGYTFAKTGSGVEGVDKGVRIARIPMDVLGIGTQRIEGELFINAKVTGQPLGFFFADIVEQVA